MGEVAAFPALARAKKLFLQRKRVAKRCIVAELETSKPNRRREIPTSNDFERAQDRPEPAPGAFARRCSSSLITFCSDFDEQLQLITRDVLLASKSARREYERKSIALDKLTTELLDGQVHEIETSVAIQRRGKQCRVQLRVRRPSIKLSVVLRFPKKAQPPEKPVANPNKLSRAALLAHQVLKAKVLQAYTRLYLYNFLYRGGSSQLTAAIHLAGRCRQTRAFRHWRRVVTHRAKLRLRCRRAQQRIESSATSWARSRAVKVLATEGKYATAKAFHQTKLTAKTFRTWLCWFSQHQTALSCSNSLCQTPLVEPRRAPFRPYKDPTSASFLNHLIPR